MEFKGPKKEKIEEQARKFCFCIRLVKDLSTQAASTQKFQSPVIISILLSDANPKRKRKRNILTKLQACVKCHAESPYQKQSSLGFLWLQKYHQKTISINAR